MVLIRNSLSCNYSSLSAELYAIYLTIVLICSSTIDHHQSLIATDSLSAVKILQNYQSRSMHPIGKIILRQLHSRSNLQVTLAWIPGHKGIPGNNLADTAAKEVTRINPVPNTATPLSDIRGIIYQRITHQWQ
ncbi:hypothetical protein PGB90_006930 [Kerria lacca]